MTKLNKVGTGLGSDVLLLMVITRHWSVTLLRFLQYLDEAVHTGKQSLWQRLEFQGFHTVQVRVGRLFFSSNSQDFY